MSDLLSNKSNQTLSELLKPIDNDIPTDDLSMSQLELLANKKKLIKQSNDIPVSEILSSKKESIKSEPIKLKSQKSSSKSSLSSVSTNSSSSFNPRKYEKEPKKISKKTIEQENENPTVRREKSELISKINRLNVDTGNKYSGFAVNMDISLYDLRNELQRLETEVSNEQKVKMLRTGLSFTVQGLEWLNTAYDPVGVDLVGWTNNLNIQLETKQYDKVLMELYDKYFTGESNLPPELKLLAMLLVSGAGYAVTKKMQNATQAKLEKMMESMKIPQSNQGPQIPNANTLFNQKYDNTTYATETIDDPMPSKIPSPDSLDLKNILAKMKENKVEKEKTIDDLIDESISSEEIFKSIDMTLKKKGATKGRKKKN